MTETEQLITNFYQAFSKKDFASMQQCYADDAVFTDEVFVNLNAEEVKAMWEMFCVKGKELQIDFSNVHADEKTGSANWVATYTFSATGRMVINRITAQFVLEKGKIKTHTDSFNFYTWASQAFGITGIVLGWTNYFKNKVRKQAKKSLLNYMNRK